MAGVAAVMEAVEESVKASSTIINTTDEFKFMKYQNRFPSFCSLLNMALLAGAYAFLPAILPSNLPGQDLKATPAQPQLDQRTFVSPDEAVKALQTATQTKDTLVLQEIFGPDFEEIQTGDRVQDANNAQRFAAAMSQSCTQVKESDDKITLEVGTNNWPYPIPLEKAGGQWFFDTAVGKEEMINRHIGKDELCAIGVCRTYVIAQRQYASANPAIAGIVSYAQKFKSAPGKKDGLYWPVAEGETASPFGPLVAEAHAEGYVAHRSARPHPFHGYYFNILKRQGEAAPGGKMNYMSQGNLAGGFALVAYPEHWGQSGIMTFIVAQDGKVFQQNLGEKTSRIAGQMKEYNPDAEWTLVPDEGVSSAASEK